MPKSFHDTQTGEESFLVTMDDIRFLHLLIKGPPTQAQPPHSFTPSHQPAYNFLPDPTPTAHHLPPAQAIQYLPDPAPAPRPIPPVQPTQPFRPVSQPTPLAILQSLLSNRKLLEDIATIASLILAIAAIIFIVVTLRGGSEAPPAPEQAPEQQEESSLPKPPARPSSA